MVLFACSFIVWALHRRQMRWRLGSVVAILGVLAVLCLAAGARADENVLTPSQAIAGQSAELFGACSFIYSFLV